MLLLPSLHLRPARPPERRQWARLHHPSHHHNKHHRSFLLRTTTTTMPREKNKQPPNFLSTRRKKEVDHSGGEGGGEKRRLEIDYDRADLAIQPGRSEPPMEWGGGGSARCSDREGEQIGIYLGRLVMEGNEATTIAAVVVHGHRRQEDIEGLSQSPNREEGGNRHHQSPEFGFG